MLGRRAFLLGSAALASAWALAGCPVPLPHGQDPGADLDLAHFMALSGLLLGIDPSRLDAGAAAGFFKAFSRHHHDYSVRNLLRESGFGWRPPQSLADLEARGIFLQERRRQLADAILEAWYSGVAPGPAGPQVVTYSGAYLWPAIGRAVPPTVCCPGWWNPGSLEAW